MACSTPYGEAPTTDKSDGPNPGGQEAGNDPTPGDAPCKLYGPVGQPEKDDDPTVEVPPFIMAVDNLIISETTPSIGTLGFDIDGVCTCDTRAGNAHGGESSCKPKGSPICDADGGIDNSFGKLISTFDTFGSFADMTKVKERINSGRQTLLVYMRRYNGRANDRDVEIGLLPSDGVRTAGCAGSTQNSDGNYNPGWCGDDAWTTVPEGQIADGTPIALANGYVNNYRFVVNLPATARVPLGPVPLEVGTPIITGKLIPLDENLNPRPPGDPPATEKQKRLYKVEEGQLVGRMVVQSLLATLGAADVSGGNDRLCQSILYVQLRKEICAAIDIARAPSLDFQSYACDALSASLGFTAQPAVRGAAYLEQLAPNDCLPVNGAPKVPTQYAPDYNCPP
ncbi:hypothetical protein AKJ09_09164 [Labilithrix luteola]|uniref:Uncharacterized protein n=1 Tax=Labilithrix luteola TaxID=1391654 RepID=A0A0K1Q9M8_9BACT|nr:hypothetical protein [Labilithrix luteola]AKV02501.1 hypothetical protein AKJ09_09164 [Labilithrix luteola]